MKASEVQAVLREELAPWFREAGFRRAQGMLSWYREHGARCTVVWFQVSRDGFDDYAGAKFTVDFQRSAEPVVGEPGARSARLGWLLPADALEQLRARQNAVIDELPPPPQTHFVLHASESAAARYRRKFEPVATPYVHGDDIWLRYRTAEHVRAWARFVREHLPLCVAQVEAWT